MTRSLDTMTHGTTTVAPPESAFEQAPLGTVPARSSGLVKITLLRKGLGCLLMIVALLFFLCRGYDDERTVLQLRDFKQPYSSARCLLKGCNPYSEAETEAAFVQAGGDNSDVRVFEPYSALYPPFSFAVLAPVAALPYPVAARVWMAFVAVSFSAAVVLTAELCLSFASVVSLVPLALMTATSTILLMLGQISGPVISLCIIGLWCLIRGRATWLAVVCLSLAAVLKPHDAALLILYLPFAGRTWRRAFVAIAVACVVVVAAGTYWCAHTPAAAHWLQDLQTNLRGNSSAGAVNDPHRGYFEAVNMANLQALLAPAFPAVAVYNRLALGITALLLAFWSVPAIRMVNSRAKHVLALGGLACITLLPIYHRQYDTRILLVLSASAAMLLLWRARTWGVAALLLVFVGYVLTAHQYLNRLTLGHHPAIAQASTLKTILLYRPLPLIELTLAIFFVAAFWAAYRASTRRGAEPLLVEI
ncbi:glycosyltransferase family 87 protein [Acidipila sp. EB88]|uniref:glycosyltransferase family 87 protein n=1 Tax=Acidipila sp. EB88 TaxID=2305226 RepID=UPI0013154EF5|nr:glycosyltransferase family 87 protein [Acidipila sp. EB88]